jgi:hypothetical protein
VGQGTDAVHAGRISFATASGLPTGTVRGPAFEGGGVRLALNASLLLIAEAWYTPGAAVSGL